MEDLSALWEPISIGGLTIPNRIVVSAHVPGMDGRRYGSYLAERARGGAGLLVTGAVSVHPTSYAGLTMKGWERDVVDELRFAVDAVHAESRALIVQLFHVGINDTGTGTRDEWGPLYAPSAVPSPVTRVTPKVMDEDDIREVIEGFVVSARHAKEAGADGVEVHGAHGYLLAEFLSPLTNTRTDGYGGDPERRARLVLEIGTAVRQELGDDTIVGMKLNFDDFVGERGITPDEAERTLAILHAASLFDYISISCANYHSLHYLIAPESSGLAGHTAEHGAIARRVVKEEIPVMVTGAVRTLEQAAEIVQTGRADLVGMVRAHMAEPALVAKAQAGRRTEIRRCVGANQGCWRRLATGLSCTVNPVTGREAQLRDALSTPTTRPRTILVVGGGPAGMKLAETAALRGHRVTVVERDSELGGQIRHAGRLPRRAGWAHLVEDLAGSLERLGVDTKLNTEMTTSAVKEFGADTVFVATGSAWDLSGRYIDRIDRREILAGPGSHIIDPITAITAAASCGHEIVIVDDTGDYLPLGLAEQLATTGRHVSIVTPAAAPGSKLGAFGTLDLPWIYPRVLSAGVDLVTSYYVDSVEENRVSLTSVWGSHTAAVAADTVILTMMRRSNESLYHELHDDGVDVRRIGDCVAPREVDDAILDGLREGCAV